MKAKTAENLKGYNTGTVTVFTVLLKGLIVYVRLFTALLH